MGVDSSRLPLGWGALNTSVLAGHLVVVRIGWRDATIYALTV